MTLLPLFLRSNLAAKAKLYEELASGKTIPDEDGSKLFLVDFERKAMDTISDKRREQLAKEEEEKKQREQEEAEEERKQLAEPLKETEDPQEEWWVKNTISCYKFPSYVSVVYLI